jgi:hypothetical protein
MSIQKLSGPFLLLVALVLPASGTWAMGEILGETKEQLKLKYELTVSEPVNGQVGVVFILEDEGRMKPLSAVELGIPRQDGSGSYDLTAPLGLREYNGKQEVRFNLKTDWAARAEIWLNTNHFDGKGLVMTHYHHLIPLAQHMAKLAPAKPAAAPVAAPPHAATSTSTVPASPPPADRAPALAALEHKLLGTWLGPACGGDYTFNADGTYAMHNFTPGQKTLTGTWFIRWDSLPPTLVVTCKTSDFTRTGGSEYQYLGKPLELRIVQLDDQLFIYHYPGDTFDQRNERPSLEPHGKSRLK